MSEEIKKINVFEAFASAQMTFVEAEEKAKKEAGAPRVERFRLKEDGDCEVRILPLAPTFDENGNILPMERKGYEYPLHQVFASIEAPNKKGGKSKKISIPIIRATDEKVGFSVDLIDTYVKIAKEMYGDDEKAIKFLTSGSYQGQGIGLRWSYMHNIMVLDVSSEQERAKGPQLWSASHSQYRNLDSANRRLWAKRRLGKNGKPGIDTCPISALTDAFPVTIVRTENNKKTEYSFDIGREELDVTEAELNALLNLPRIPELIYRYTRYQMEATLVWLQQIDERMQWKVCQESDFIAAVDTLKGELPADDTSHFDLNGATKGEEKISEVTLNSLWVEYDALTDQGLGEKSDEYQDLREKIRQFIEDKGLDIRIGRSKNNQQLLTEIEEMLSGGQSNQPDAKKEEDVEDEPAPAARRAPRPKPEPEYDEEEEPQTDPEPEPAQRRRRPRPDSDIEEEPEVKPEPQPEEEAPADDEAPRRRRRAFR